MLAHPGGRGDRLDHEAGGGQVIPDQDVRPPGRRAVVAVHADAAVRGADRGPSAGHDEDAAALGLQTADRADEPVPPGYPGKVGVLRCSAGAGGKVTGDEHRPPGTAAGGQQVVAPLRSPGYDRHDRHQPAALSQTEHRVRPGPGQCAALPDTGPAAQAELFHRPEGPALRGGDGADTGRTEQGVRADRDVAAVRTGQRHDVGDDAFLAAQDVGVDDDGVDAVEHPQGRRIHDVDAATRQDAGQLGGEALPPDPGRAWQRGGGQRRGTARIPAGGGGGREPAESGEYGEVGVAIHGTVRQRPRPFGHHRLGRGPVRMTEQLVPSRQEGVSARTRLAQHDHPVAGVDRETEIPLRQGEGTGIDQPEDDVSPARAEHLLHPPA